MPIAINGTGTISGVSAGGLTSASNGRVLQVVTTVYSTGQSFSTSNGVYTDTGLTASITPSSASNKVLVLVTVGHQTSFSGNGNCGSALGLKRNATRIVGPVGNHIGTITSAEAILPTGNIIMLDSPASTSSVTYTVQVTSIGNSQTVYFNRNYAVTGFDAYITLMEVAG
jgi:hypothetical protein